jgi:hypothetical protein
MVLFASLNYFLKWVFLQCSAGPLDMKVQFNFCAVGCTLGCIEHMMERCRVWLQTFPDNSAPEEMLLEKLVDSNFTILGCTVQYFQL